MLPGGNRGRAAQSVMSRCRRPFPFSHKTLAVIADRILTGDLNMPRESSMTLLRDIIMSGNNSPDWQFHASGRKTLQRVLNAFSDCLGPETHKYVCAPCSNCKGQIRDMPAYYGMWDKHRILCGGLVELIVNAMVDVKPGYIQWEWP